MTNKLITHEEAKINLISLTAKFIIPSVEETDYGCLYDRCHFYNSLEPIEEAWLKSVKDYITQQEQRDKDIARYFELFERFELYKSGVKKPYGKEWNMVTLNEMERLYEKLSKGVAK